MSADQKPAPVTFTVSASVRWWVRPYIRALAFVATVMGAEPDWERLESLIARKGIRVSIVRKG